MRVRNSSWVRGFVLSGLLAVPLTAATQTPERSRTQGLKETDQFVKAGGNTSEAVGSDLTPSAVTSLKPNAEKFNARGAELFAKTDQAIAGANPYFQGLRSAES